MKRAILLSFDNFIHIFKQVINTNILRYLSIGLHFGLHRKAYYEIYILCPLVDIIGTHKQAYINSINSILYDENSGEFDIDKSITLQHN